ncbi:MAG: hypothetical protein ACOYM2_03110 [Rectinemataceae bacterium]
MVQLISCGKDHANPPGQDGEWRSVNNAFDRGKWPQAVSTDEA